MTEEETITSLRVLSKEEKAKWWALIGRLGMFDTIMSDGRIAWCRMRCAAKGDCPFKAECINNCCVIL